MHRLITVILLAVGLSASGCASPASYLVPARMQPSGVDYAVQDTYEVLSSQKQESAVSLSLRSATEEYLQLFVAVQNVGSGEQAVWPARIQVTAEGAGGTRTFAAYAPEEAPNFVRQDAQEDARTASRLMEATGRIYASSQPSGGGASAYEVETASGGAEVLLQPVQLAPGMRAAGFVYAPFSMDYERLAIKIPVADEMHEFRYEFRVQDYEY